MGRQGRNLRVRHLQIQAKRDVWKTQGFELRPMFSLLDNGGVYRLLTIMLPN